MKNLILVTLLLGLISAQASTPIEKLVPVDHVYAPAGFDSNDTAEIVITGFLPNLCHKTPTSKVKRDGNKVEIEISSLYYHESNPYCPEMIVPFEETVSLGLLDKGKYHITVNGKSQWEIKEKLSINESTSASVDDHHYAYVNYIEKEHANDVVELKGYNPSDCFELDRIEYVSNGKDSYSVLPIMKQVRGFCPMKMVPFSYKWKVPSDISARRILLHVRTMDGKSVNSVFYRY